MSDLFGWELLYKYTENDLNKKEDMLVLLVHYILIKSGYKCIGLGDDKTLTGNEISQEVLPPGWSSSSNYGLRYVLNNQLYILRAVPVDRSLVFNLMSTKGKLHDTIPSYEEVITRVKKELLNPTDSVSKEVTTQTQQQAPPPSSSTRTPPEQSHSWPETPTPTHVSPSAATSEPFWFDVERDPLRVGRSDLDPLARGGGGGMIFNPFEPRHGGIPDPGIGSPGLPRGSIPPHARFDPFGPPGPPRPFPRHPPDPDHFNPPEILTTLRVVFVFSSLFGIAPFQSDFSISIFLTCLSIGQFLASTWASAVLLHQNTLTRGDIFLVLGLLDDILIILWWLIYLTSVLVPMLRKNVFRKLVMLLFQNENWFQSNRIKVNYKKFQLYCRIAATFLVVLLTFLLINRVMEWYNLYLHVLLCVLYLIQLQVSTILHVSTAQLNSLNTNLNFNRTLLVLKDSIKTFKNICLVSELMIKFYQSQLLISMINVFIRITTNGLAVIQSIQKIASNKQLPWEYTRVRWIALFILMDAFWMWDVLYRFYIFQKKIEDFNVQLYRAVINDSKHRLVKDQSVYFQLISHATTKVNFNLHGLFDLDMTTFQSMLASSATYILLVIQFDDESELIDL